jgi:hypothetical protein
MLLKRRRFNYYPLITQLFQVRPDIMSRLIEEEVYKPVHLVDYQAVCFREKKTTNPATMLLTVRSAMLNVTINKLML